MQGREAKHIKLARYVENTCNMGKSDRWWVVFWHEYIFMIWLQELDRLSITVSDTQGIFSDFLMYTWR